MCAHKRMLAVEEDFGHVAECDCGTIHLTVGAISVTANVEALLRLEQLLGAALTRLSSPPEGVTEDSQIVGHPLRLH